MIDKNKLEASKLAELELHNTILADKYSEVREGSNKFSRYYQNLWLEEMLSLVDGDQTKEVLDYCGGTSLLFPYIQKFFPQANYTVLDLSDGMLAVGKKRFANVSKFSSIQADGENMIEVKNESFDLVISRGAIHHLPHPEQGLREIYRVLKSGGSLIISEPTSNFLVNGFRKFFYKVVAHFSGTHKSFTNKELNNLLREAGFKINKVKRFGFLAFPFGLPDIVPFLGIFPFWLLRPLVTVDKILVKIPIIKTFYFTTLIEVKKELD